MHVGRRWQISSDFLPVLAIAGLASHVIWFLIIAILFGISKPASCSDSTPPGRLLESVLDGTLCIMGISCLLECPIIAFGLQGRPFPPCGTAGHYTCMLARPNCSGRLAATDSHLPRLTRRICAGTPFEESKRHRIRHVLWARLVLWIVQFLFNCE